MIIKHLGPTIDINCGGIDNIYRHHDYNIAVMEAYTGKEFARYYLHGEHLIVAGKSMSKSRGNILYPENVLGKGLEARDLRFMLFHTHYRDKLNFTFQGMKKAAARLSELRARVKELTSSRRASGPGDDRAVKTGARLTSEFEKIADRDLAVGAAFDRIETMLGELTEPVGKKGAAALKEPLQKIDHVLQVLRRRVDRNGIGGDFRNDAAPVGVRLRDDDDGCARSLRGENRQRTDRTGARYQYGRSRRDPAPVDAVHRHGRRLDHGALFVGQAVGDGLGVVVLDHRPLGHPAPGPAEAHTAHLG